MQPFHEEIIKARQDHGFYPRKRQSNSKVRRKVKKLKTQLKKVRFQNDTLNKAISGASQTETADVTKSTTRRVKSDNDNKPNEQAGLSFGGKRSMRKRKQATQEDSDSSI